MFCLHHRDHDGFCSAAVVNYKYSRCRFKDINYGEEIDFESLIKPNEITFIVDFSLETEESWKRLLKVTKNVIWIDHHKSILKYNDVAGHLEGVRKVGNLVSACFLTWKFLFPDQEVPEIVKLISDFDTWTFKYGDKTWHCFYGLYTENYTNPKAKVWEICFDSNEPIKSIIDKGKIAKQAIGSLYRECLAPNKFFVNLEGYKGICINYMRCNSSIFSTAKEDFDIMIPFYYNGSKWIFSLYAGDKDIDVSKIAEKFGGGGHKGAAGFKLDNIQDFLKYKI